MNLRNPITLKVFRYFRREQVTPRKWRRWELYIPLLFIKWV